MAKEMRKVRVGAVIRTRMDRTAVVETVWRQRHPVYGKLVRRVARYYVHDPESRCTVGDTVRIQETRPISKTKHWRLLEILQRRQVADVRPIELEHDAQVEEEEEEQAAAPEGATGDADLAEGDDEDNEQ